MSRAAEARVTMSERVEEIVVDLGPRSYPVLVGANVLALVGPRLAALGFRNRCAVLTSERIGALYREPLQASLREAELEPVVVEIPDGEEHKNFAWLAVIYDRLIEAGIDRRTPIVALGGGVIGDLGGFAAGTLLRGLPLVQVPTTLLAQVDAAVGGKTGVNHALGKNLVGVFHQPQFVLADVEVLRTLPRREFVAGLAEVIKYGVIFEAALFRHIDRHLDGLLALRRDLLVSVVTASCRHKAAVVAADEREEHGQRTVLNFGHTIGHAIETLTDYKQLLHGEAVAIGMVAAARVSRALGCCGSETVERLEGLLQRAGLPTEIPRGLKPGAIALAMQTDKKSAAGRIRFVAVEEIGRTRLIDLSAAEIASQL
jgi:3-dehydroquinate synthase